MKQSIFDISEEYMRIAAEMQAHFQETDSDELPEELYDRLVVNRGEMEVKLTNYRYLIDEWKGYQQILKDKIESLSAKIHGYQRSIDRLESFMAQAIELYGEPVTKKGEPTGSYRFKGIEFTITKIHTNPVVIEDETQLPDEYKRFSIVLDGLDKDQADIARQYLRHAPVGINEKIGAEKTTIYKSTIKEAMQNGQDVPGAKIDTAKHYLKYS